VSVSTTAVGDRPGVAAHADFSRLRYAQCWEDADVLLAALDVQPGDTCLSIASAGDNSLSLLTRDPARVICLDLSAPQLACLELRVAAYRALDHGGLLQLLGSRESDRRAELYAQCRPGLSDAARGFWDGRPDAIALGFAAVGKFERYLRLFRCRVLPLVHRRARVERLLRGGTPAARQAFYDDEWDTVRWRLMFRLFFSRRVMGRAGRDPAFFRHVDGEVAAALLARTRYALTVLDPAENAYVAWILTGRHDRTLPHALRPEHFETIRARLDRVEWQRAPLEAFVASCPSRSIDRCNLSDIFEYLSPEAYAELLKRLIAAGRHGGRLVYWNLLAERRRPAALADRLRPLDALARDLHARDKAFFYRALVVEEIV
jgi:S-adenosylmethionine-diacylglycerol 3-amino-3-carboxypropyl transferase